MEADKQQSVYIWGMFLNKDHPIPTKVKQLQGKGAQHIASGGFFYLVSTTTGHLYGWGNNKYHRFGLPNEEQIAIPKQIPLKIQARAISAGNWHSMLIDETHHVWATGHNKQGACGTGSFETVSAYTPIHGEITAKVVSCGDCFSLILTQEGELYSCGHKDMHGHKSKDHLSKPKKLQFDGHKVRGMHAGFSHALVATEEGLTYSWGDGVFYQLGHGGKAAEKEPRIVKGLQGVKIVQVSCSRGEKNAHSMAVSQGGEVYSWGAGYKGKLGHQASWSHENAADEQLPRKIQALKLPIKKVSAGGIHSNVLSETGEILSFGCGSNGRLGHPESKQHVYLYRQGYPRVIDTLKDTMVIDIESSYYHNICIGHKR